MEARIHPKRLLVEGANDKRIIPELIEANGVMWGDTAAAAVVDISGYDGISNLVRPGIIESELKASGLVALGILADADTDVDARFQAIRSRCLEAFPNIPDALPQTGLVISNSDGLRLGIWLMPDNTSVGMIESFLARLIDTADRSLLTHAENCCRSAITHGATYKPNQIEKAQLHTYLAWQDEPGMQLHNAVKYLVLKPTCTYAQPFVCWFRQLFEV